MNLEYHVIRSSRRTLAVQIVQDGVVVRAPRYASSAEIESFVRSHKDWIVRHMAEVEEQKSRMSGVEPLSWDEVNELAQKAMKVIPERVRYYAPKIGVDYGKITIRNQRTRWGSCSSKGNLNFNCLLMLAPQEAIDSVVVHELCHRKEMNHSDHFYSEVLRVFPDYWKWDRWLKENGPVLMKRGGLR